MKRLQRMPGASFERPRAYKLNDIEQPHQQHHPATKGGPGGFSSSGGGGGNTSRSSAAHEDPMASSPLGSSQAANMGSLARFPKLDECAHFHYEHVELGNLEVSMSAGLEASPVGSYAVRVTSGDACWTLQRSYDNFVLFDKQLHRCIFDRQFSQLADLAEVRQEREEQNVEAAAVNLEDELEELEEAKRLQDYLRRFSSLSHEGLNCGPVLNWLQLDNRGRRILVPEADSCPINTPAVAAAYAVRPHQAQAQDEISFQVGDMISVIDMPPAGESSWWRGKHGFAVGFFPAECVAVIGDKLPRHLGISAAAATSSSLSQPLCSGQGPSNSQASAALGRLQPSRLQPVKPVLRKHGKLIAFFRSFILNRPSRRRLKQSGILRERVFGCDLGEHLLNSAQDVPCVLTCCAEFIERHGLVDGIYRLSGVTSNIQRLRHAFDEDRVPALHSDETILQDIHSVASLLKMYFRELPNPLCTYQLYSSFVSAVQAASDAERLRRMREAVRKLPPPHYRTLEYLMRHLVRVAAHGEETGMTPRNVAIVWAPNLLRCKELEVGGVAALQGVGVQAVVTEFLICYAELIFAVGPSEPSGGPSSSAACTSGGQRPKSLAIAGSSARLLSLEEARNRSLPAEPEAIDVGPGPAGLPPRYHTVIELPQSARKRNGSKRSPSLNWRALFGGRQSSKCSRTPGPSGPSSVVTREIVLPEPQPAARRLRPAKSADSIEGGAEDGLGPLLAAGPARPCGHSRSVSHDSYFEQLGEAASAASATSAASALDLSEIQLSFELEEREMRMLSEADSLEASPRRPLPGSASSLGLGQTAGGQPAGGGGSKRKRSRLEERLHCEVELRFIDSQSPDQVMVSAEVHEMESPSPLATPGYLPLLSEASTPLTPTPSPAAVSPRISFKSFVLPLEVGDTTSVAGLKEPLVQEKTSPLRSSSLTKASREQDSSSSCLDLDCSTGSLSIKRNSAMEAYEGLLETPVSERPSSLTPQHLAFGSHSTATQQLPASEIVDQEMTPCERFADLDTTSEMNEEASFHGINVSTSLPSGLHDTSEQCKTLDNSFGKSEAANDRAIGQAMSAQNNNTTDLSSMTDLDTLMPYEQSCEHTTNTNFMPIDPREKITNNATNAPMPNYDSNLRNAEKWIMADFSSGSLTSSNKVNENQLKRITDPNITQISSPGKCQSNSNSPKNHSDSMCYSESDIDYRIQPNAQSTNANNSEFSPACESDESNVARYRDSNQIDETELLNLLPQKTDLLTTNHDTRGNQINSDTAACQTNANIKSYNNYQNDQIESQISTWESLLSDKIQCDTNQNEKDKSVESQDQNIKYFNQGKCEDVQAVDLIIDRQEKAADNNTCDDTNESQNNCSKSLGQLSNCSPSSEYYSKCVGQESNNSSSTIQTTRIKDHLDVVVPSDSAAVEPQEMAHVPEMLSESISLDSSCTFSSTNNTSLERDTITHKDTAAILQELALQRLSGADRIEAIPTRRRYDSDLTRDRRSFDSEIGREIVREHKMKQELENARGKLDESLANNHNQTAPASHLPPCLRARHARATRAALSRSLDEAKFNKMTSGGGGGGSGAEEYLPRMKQNKAEVSQQHGSTPNVGSKSGSQTGISERSTQSLNKNLGLDLDDPRCRERIEKYKEERRTFLRDKYRSESFRASASPAATADTASSNKEDGEQALLARLKQRASRPSVL